MPRAIWSGAISFGLVNVPVRMYSAISEHNLQFHFVHAPDQSPIGYQKICKLENKPVPDDEVVKAFEFEPGEYVAKFVMRDRQYLGALRVRDGVITLEQMYFADEIRPLDEIKPPKTKVSKEGLAMAEQLIDRFAGEFEPKKYKDTYRDALCEIIRSKRAGKEVHRAPETEEAAPPDLLEALRASIAAASGNGRSRRARASGNGSRGDLSELSKSELDERARRAKIPGRSKMSKDELIEALS